MIVGKVRMFVLLALLGVSLVLNGYLAFQLNGSYKAEAKSNKDLADLRQEATQKIADLQEQMRETETLMSRSVAVITEQKNAKFVAVVAERDALLKRVRLAEARAAAAARVSQATGTPGDGQAPRLDIDAELLGTFGSEDVEEASRADIIRAGLLACYKQYDAAREALSQ